MLGEQRLIATSERANSSALLVQNLAELAIRRLFGLTSRGSDTRLRDTALLFIIRGGLSRGRAPEKVCGIAKSSPCSYYVAAERVRYSPRAGRKNQGAHALVNARSCR